MDGKQMNVHIRPMLASDVDSVHAIEEVAHRAPWGREIIGDCILVGYDCRVLEIEKNIQPQIVGYMISRYYEHYCHILNLCVAPSHQGKGYGRLLINDLIKSLQDPKANTLILEVRPSNSPALSLYQRMGFYQTGIKAKYYCDDFGIEDAVILEKSV